MDSYLDIAQSVIRHEANGLVSVAESLGDEFNLAIQYLLTVHGRVIVTGIGKSGLIGRKVSATLSSTGTKSCFLHPTEALHGDLGEVSADDCILALSSSGETEELLRIVPFLKRYSSAILSVTGSSESTLARQSQFHITCNPGREACPLNLAPTTSTTAMLALGDAIAVSLMSARGFGSDSFARLHPGGSLGNRLLLQVGDAMRPATFVSISDMFLDVVKAMTIARQGVVCVGTPTHLEGVITDGDLRRAIAKLGNEAIDTRAQDIMSIDPKVVMVNKSYGEAVDFMQRHNVNSLVVTHEATIVGVFGILNPETRGCC